MKNNIAYIIQLDERKARGFCMLGNIYSSQLCPICDGRLVHDERRRGCFCEAHRDIAAIKGFYVKFPASPIPIFRRFGRDYEAAVRFLTALRYRHDQIKGPLDSREYMVNSPLGFSNLAAKWIKIKKSEGLSKSQISNLSKAIGRACETFQNRNIKEITNGEIDDFIHDDHISDRSGAVIKSKTRSELRSALHQFYVWVCRREKNVEMPSIPSVSFELGWRDVVDLQTHMDIIDRIKKLSWGVNPKIWLATHILSHNQEVRPGELLKCREQDILINQDIIMIRWPKEGSLRGKQAHLWSDEIDVIRSFPPALPSVPFFRHRPGLSGVKAGDRFSTRLLTKWAYRACDSLGIPQISIYPLTKHSVMSAMSKELTPEQIRRGGSKHASKAMERYLVPDIHETRLYQNTLQRMRSEVAECYQSDTKKRGT